MEEKERERNKKTRTTTENKQQNGRPKSNNIHPHIKSWRVFNTLSKHQRLQDCRKARPSYILCIKDVLYTDWDRGDGALTDGVGSQVTKLPKQMEW